MVDVEKLVQLVGYLLKKNNNRLNYTKLIKILYLADKESYNAINHSMTGDSYFSLPQGPVLSELLDFIKGKADEKRQSFWDARFTTDGYDLVSLSSNIPEGKLSKFEKHILDDLDVKFHDKDYGYLIDYVHNSENCPEWQNPGEHSRKPIMESDILKSIGRNEKEIDAIEKDNKAFEKEEIIFATLGE